MSSWLVPLDCVIQKVSDLQPLEFGEQPEVTGSQSYQENRSLANNRSIGFHQKKSESSVRNVLEHCCDRGAKCLLTTAPVSCTARHHIGNVGHRCSTLWWLFDPVVHTRGVE